MPVSVFLFVSVSRFTSPADCEDTTTRGDVHLDKCSDDPSSGVGVRFSSSSGVGASEGEFWGSSTAFGKAIDVDIESDDRTRMPFP